MKYTILVIYLTLFYCQASSLANPDSLSQYILLPAGTTVSLSLNEDLNSDQVSVGQSIEFFVHNPVIIKGHEVIAKGQVAIGRVKSVEKTCFGACGFHEAKITIIAEQVQTKSGLVIYLRGIPFTRKGDGYSYSPATATIGTIIRSRVLNNEKLLL